MKIEALLEKLLSEKKEITEACKVSSGSIDFWERRAEELFSKMEESEDDFIFASDKVIEETCSSQLKEIDFLMKRMQFENSQLDLLEKKVEGLEETISQTLAEHAKKQKK
tara:strand:+ start:482 stop:811 length:330 start_codon:yes stop_codon:yes gene_type:complete